MDPPLVDHNLIAKNVVPTGIKVCHTSTVSTCFVIQPFDKGKFDKRFEDVFKPAIEAAGLCPYRVDQDIHVSIPIEDIERGIRNADICFAEISTDNPNVWFELGYAIAARKEVIMVCSTKERTSMFPFDIRHRAVITHDNESTSDFDTLKERITAKLVAILKKNKHIQQLSETVVKGIEGLEQHEMITLATTAENLDSPNERISAHLIKRDMERSGFTNLATTLALRKLLNAGLLDSLTIDSASWDELPYAAYGLTEKGWLWLEQNKSKLLLKRERLPEASGDEVPF